MAIPLGLYIHFPWCKTKCPYCDFNSHAVQTNFAEANFAEASDLYLQALVRELQTRSHLANKRSVQSIYCGGGTPNLIPPERLAWLFARLHDTLDIAPDCEITLEANPGKGRIHDYQAYAQAGCNRLSIGVQSFNAQTLARLGRDYTPDELHQTLEQAFAGYINNINLDILFATPGQTSTMLAQDVQQAVAWHPHHLSLYELTIEPNTIFYRRPPDNLPDEQKNVAMHAYITDFLHNTAYHQYEVSAWSKKGCQCRHNRNYWEFGDYLAIGAGAHAKITCEKTNQVLRYANPKHPQTYSQCMHFPQPQVQPKNTLLLQLCLNAFRLSDGMKLSDAALRTAMTEHELLNTWQKWIDLGLLHVVNKRFMLSQRAYRNQNQLLSQLL